MGLLTYLALAAGASIGILIALWLLLALSLYYGSTAATNLNSITGYNSNDDLMSADKWLTTQGWVGWIWLILSIAGAIIGFILAIIVTLFTAEEGAGSLPWIVLIGFYMVLAFISIFIFLIVGIFALLAVIDINKADIQGNDNSVKADSATSLGIVIFAIIFVLFAVIILFYFFRKIRKWPSKKQADIAKEKQAENEEIAQEFADGITGIKNKQQNNSVPPPTSQSETQELYNQVKNATVVPTN